MTDLRGSYEFSCPSDPACFNPSRAIYSHVPSSLDEILKLEYAGKSPREVLVALGFSSLYIRYLRLLAPIIMRRAHTLSHI